MLKRLIATAVLVVMLIASINLPVFAASESYSRIDIPGDTTENILSREMYRATERINAASLGLDARLDGITDIYAAEDNSILLLCGDDSRLIALNADYTLDKEILVKDSDGNEIDFKGAKGVYKDYDGNIYIADTDNAKILMTDGEGQLLKELELPESDLIPEDFLYQPVAITKDKQGYTYILSLGCYYGALLYSPEDVFLGFYGANTVKASALDTLAYIWEKFTSNDTKKSNDTKTLPFSFADFSFDSEGYMVTCTGNTGKNQYGSGQIRKISHNGSDILYKRSLRGASESASALNFLEKEIDEFDAPQNLVSVAVSDDDYIFALDRTYGTVYIYDSECNLMSAFGGGIGEGQQLGVFKTAVSLTLCGDDILVADLDDASITVFKTTEYGTLLREAQTMYLRGDYNEAKALWEKVLADNRNCQLAYKGLAMAYYNEGDYDKAIDAAKTALDYSVYDMAWQQKIKDFVAESFVFIILAVAVIVGALIYVAVYIKKRSIKLIKNEKTLLLLKAQIHPFEGFEDLKYKKLGSYKLAIIIAALFYISSVLSVTNVGFLYQNTLIRNYNSLFTLGSTIGLLVLWSVSNWLVCSMFSGKGSFKEVFVSTAYALVPLVVFTFIKVAVSHFLPISSMNTLNGIQTAVIIYTLFLLCVAMIKVHEYDFFKFILTGIVIILFMILIIFVLLMFVILVKQLGVFIYSIYEEIAFR